MPQVVLSLEGGYDLPSICDAAQECVRALLGDVPCQNAVDTLQKTIAVQLTHWPCVKRLAHTVACSHHDARQKKEEAETVTAMASLSMQHPATASLRCAFFSFFYSFIFPLQNILQ
jgi:histone deacetylase 4/5